MPQIGTGNPKNCSGCVVSEDLLRTAPNYRYIDDICVLRNTTTLPIPVKDCKSALKAADKCIDKNMTHNFLGCSITYVQNYDWGVPMGFSTSNETCEYVHYWQINNCLRPHAKNIYNALVKSAMAK